MLSQFGTTSEIATADVLCKSCLLSPGAVDLSDLPLDLVREAATDTDHRSRSRGWYTACCALIAYREGNPQQAIGWSQFISRTSIHSDSLARVVRAMAQHQLGQTDTARETLSRVETQIPLILRTLGTESWNGPLPVPATAVSPDWLIVELLRREASIKIR